MQEPELSILMLAYNSGDYIGQSVRSLLDQTYKDFELIIVDDNSTDETAEIINSFDDLRIKYMANRENKGVAYCRNKALKMAKGNFVSFFDSDDLAHPDKYQKQIGFLKGNNKYGFAGTSVILIDNNNYETGRWKLDSPYEKILLKMIFNNYFVNSAVVFYKDLVKDFKFPDDLLLCFLYCHLAL